MPPPDVALHNRGLCSALSPGSETEAGMVRTGRLACRLSRDIAGAVFDVAEEDMARPNRAQLAICNARQVAMYLAHVAFQVPLTAISTEFGRDRTTVAHAVRRVEDRRDDADFDALLTRLERLSASCRAVMGGADAEAGE